MTSARDLTNQLADLLRRERAALADFLVALAGFDRRRLWLELGHSSLFYFLHRELGLSKGAAFYRDVVTAVRAPAPALALAPAAAPLPDLARLAVHPANQLAAPRANAPANEPAPAAMPPSAPRSEPVVEPLTASRQGRCGES